MNINDRLNILETELNELKELLKSEKNDSIRHYVFILKYIHQGYMNKIFIGVGRSEISPAAAFRDLMSALDRRDAFRDYCHWIQNQGFHPSVFYYSPKNSSQLGTGNLPDYEIETILK